MSLGWDASGKVGVFNYVSIEIFTKHAKKVSETFAIMLTYTSHHSGNIL